MYFSITNINIIIISSSSSIVISVFLSIRVMAVPTTVIYYTLYDHLKLAFGFKEGETNVWSPLLAGISGRSK